MQKLLESAKEWTNEWTTHFYRWMKRAIPAYRGSVFGYYDISLGHQTVHYAMYIAWTAANAQYYSSATCSRFRYLNLLLNGLSYIKDIQRWIGKHWAYVIQCWRYIYITHCVGTDLSLEHRSNCGRMPFRTSPITLIGFKPMTHSPLVPSATHWTTVAPSVLNQ